jgi:5'-nucleotidase
MSSATAWSGPGRRAATTTFSPRLASSRANASPSPSDAPSTTPHGPYFSAKTIAFHYYLHGHEADAEARRPLRILVSNDDGVAAPGIDALVKALVAEPNVTVTVVASAENQSGSGAKTTPDGVTASDTTTASGYPAVAVQGLPADAVVHGLTVVLEERPDLVISGANAGQNLGPFLDVSGTIGAARAAAQRGIPALAVSAGLGDPIDFTIATSDAIQWLRDHRAALIASTAAPTSVDNLNAPTCPTGQVRGLVDVTADTAAPQADALAAPDCTSTVAAPSTDVAAFLVGYATLSQVPRQPAS